MAGLNKNHLENLREQINILLLTAMPTETHAVADALQPFPGEDDVLEVMDNSLCYTLGLLGNYAVALVEVGKGTALAAANTYAAIARWNPKALIMIGVAGGYKNAGVKIGDVLVAEHIFDYEAVEKKDGADIHRQTQPPISPILLNRFRAARRWHFLLPSGEPSVMHIGAMASGDKKINDAAVVEHVCSLYPKTIGVEMEGAGVGAAGKIGHRAFILVKGCCDLASDVDVRKADQPAAVRAAISLCEFVLSKPAVFEGEDLEIAPFTARVEQTESKTGMTAQLVSPLITNLPRTDNYFVRRESEMQRLKHTFHDLQQPTVAVLRALGGTGKTTLAVGFANEVKERYRAVFLVRGGSEETLLKGLADRFADLFPDDEVDDDTKRVKRVWDWLRKNFPWLLIIDGADPPAEVKNVFDAYDWSFPHGHILITSRSRFERWHGAKDLALGALSPQESLEFLAARTGASVAELDAGEKHAAQTLARKLGYFPMALEQAAAYLAPENKRKRTFTEYLQLFEARRKRGTHLRLLDKEKIAANVYSPHSKQRSDYLSLLTTWDINFRWVQEHHPASADLLKLMAFLEPNNLDTALILAARAELPASLRAPFDELPYPEPEELQEVCDELFGALTAHSLLEWNDAAQVYTMHGLEQEVLRDHLRFPDEPKPDVQETEHRWAERAAAVINTGLATDRLTVKAYPHAYHLAEILRSWESIEGEESEQAGQPNAAGWTEQNWRNAGLERFDSPFRAFYADHFVKLAQKGAVDWDALIFGMEYPSCRLLHQMEEPYWKERNRWMLQAITRMQNPDTARCLFTCIYLITHYYWDLYLSTDAIAAPLIRTWESLHPDESETELLTVLSAFHTHYPPVRDYRERVQPEKAADWKIVRDSVRGLQGLLGVDDSVSPETASSYRYVRAVTLLYLAEALRYAPEGDATQNRRTQTECYEEAIRIFEEDGSSFHRIWAQRDWAETLSEWNDPAAQEQAQTLLHNVIAQAIQIKEDDEEEELDAEVIASAYWLLADLAHKQGRIPEARGLLAAASFTAYAWKDIWTEDGDAYSFEFYGEMVEHLLDFLESGLEEREDGHVEYCPFLSEFWQHDQSQADPTEPLPSLPRQFAQLTMFPHQPTRETLAKHKAEAAARVRTLTGRLPALAEHYPQYPLPDTFAPVAEILNAEFPHDEGD